MTKSHTVLNLIAAAAIGSLGSAAMAQEEVEKDDNTDIHVEEFPNGTIYVNQDDNRFLWPADGSGRIDCNDDMKECAKHLADGFDSGDPVVTDMSADASSSRVDRAFRKNRAAAKFVKSRMLSSKRRVR